MTHHSESGETPLPHYILRREDPPEKDFANSPALRLGAEFVVEPGVGHHQTDQVLAGKESQ